MSKNHLSHTVLKEIGFSLLAEGKTIRVKAEGFSMYPSIKPGSVIFIEPFIKVHDRYREKSLPGKERRDLWFTGLSVASKKITLNL